MTQHIDIRYNDDVKSRPINRRFLDVTKATVLKGYHLMKGTGPFEVTLSRSYYLESVAISPSGARISETDDLLDVVETTPNMMDEHRVDGVFLKYEFGTRDSVATYLVVQGVGKNMDIINPNPSTHLLLGWINVPPNGDPLNNGSFRDVPKGLKIPNLVGDTIFEGDWVFKGNVTIEGELDSSFGEDIQGTFIEKMPIPIEVNDPDQTFVTHKPYIMKSNSLFVYLNDRLVLPSEILEMSTTEFRFTVPLKPGDVVWAFWFLKLQLIKTEDHHHDDRYYTKEEINRRMVVYKRGNFKGMDGELVGHNFGGLDYSLIGVVPVTKTTEAGTISVKKEDNSITVYNTGSYRGAFELGLILNNDDDIFPDGIGNVYKTVLHDQDIANNVYRNVKRYRRDLSLHSETILSHRDQVGLYKNLEFIHYDYKGADALSKRTYKIAYDSKGRIVGTERTD